METEVIAEAKDKLQIRAAAITMRALSVVVVLGNIKDWNIVQNLEKAKAGSVKYQATAHIALTWRFAGLSFHPNLLSTLLG